MLNTNTPTDATLARLLRQLDEQVPRFDRLDAHAAGRAPLSFLSPAIREQLGNRLDRVSVNVPGLLVATLAERLRLVGFDGADVWSDWTRNSMQAASSVLHLETMTLGEAYCIVWANEDGSPKVTVESPRMVTAFTDRSTGEVVLAAKRWVNADGPKAGTHVAIYGPDEITRYHSPALGTGVATTGFRRVDTIENPLGIVPVVRFTNGGRVLDDAASELDDVIPLSDALCKLTTDLLTASEYAARPRRWATGLELEEDDAGHAVSPIAEGDKLMVSEDPETKFGVLAGADLTGYQTAITTVLRLISAATGLPDHALGLSGDNPTSADALRASEGALVARAEAKQLAYGRSWSRVAALTVAVRDGVDPTTIKAEPRWADASTRSTAQEADAILKLVQAGVLTTDEARSRLGITEGNAA